MAKSEALAILSDIQAATFRNAAQLPLKESAQPEWQGIGFQLGGTRLVSPMGEVNEILKVPKITALPGVKSWLLGIANVRGRLMPIVDLGIGAGPVASSRSSAESPGTSAFGNPAATASAIASIISWNTSGSATTLPSAPAVAAASATAPPASTGWT